MEEKDNILVFVYNADSGAINLVKDFWKKLVTPSSYECNLCMQTFGMFSQKKDWKNFISSLNIKTEFLHKDEFEEQYKISEDKYPSAYLKQDGPLELLITAEEMNAANSLEEMEALVLKKINSLN